MLKLVPQKKRPGRPPDPMTIIFKYLPRTEAGWAEHRETMKGMVQLAMQRKRERIAKEVTQ